MKTRNGRHKMVALASAAALVWGLLMAAPASGPAQEDKEEGERDYIDIIHVSDFSRDGKTKITTLRGDVVLAHKDTRFYADQVVYDDENDTAVATGHLRITDPDSETVGDLIEADFVQEVAVLTGNVRMRHQKKEEASEETPPEGDNAGAAEEEPEGFAEYEKKLTIITCEKMELYYEVDRAVALGNVVAKQEDQTVYSDRLVYDKGARIITVDGQARVETEEGDILRFKGVVIDLDADRMEGELLTGRLKREKRESEEETTPASEEEGAAGTSEEGEPQ
ncbi:MAG: LptA/OstA family protein [Armatimonadota bacterium]